MRVFYTMKSQKGDFIKIMPEYGCYPIWKGTDGETFWYDDGESVMENPDISDRLNKWNKSFQRTLNNSYPPDSCFENAQQLYNFEIEGLSLWKLIISEYPDYVVVYYSIVFNKTYEDPECLSSDIEKYDFNTSEWLGNTDMTD